MDLPAFRRGLELVSADLNKLANAIRAASVTSVIGGTFTRTPGGTTIVVSDQVRGGGSGGGAKCWFKLSDATEGETIKIEIQQDQIAGRYPEGMGLGFPAFKITINSNTYFYISVKYNTTTLEIDPASDAIQIVDSDALKQATTNTIYILIGTVVVEAGKVKTIDNICDRPIPDPCGLAWGSPPSP